MARVRLTAGRVASFECPPGKRQAFLWDSQAVGLGLRVARTAAGEPAGRAYVFQSEFRGRTLRMTIGSPDVWPLESVTERSPDGQTVTRQGARQKAVELQACIDAGRDPREVKAESIAADEAKRAARRRQGATVGEAWMVYVEERRPFWSERHHKDHLKLAQAGGEKRKRGKGLTTAGPLAELLALRLQELDDARVKAWAAKETPRRAARVRLALRLLSAFLGWCAKRPAYAGTASATAAKGRELREVTGKPQRKDDVLQREQLKPWFDAVRTLDNPVLSAYLQCLLLTGARREEVAELKWTDVDFRWRALHLRDKVEGERTIPLTPYVAHLLAALPRARNGEPTPWVFSSPTSASGHITSPRSAHERACKVAGLQGLTLHGLRRSFGTLSEWVECPVGVVAQIQGHKPSAIAERHYRVRPLDLLRVWHERIERWMLDQAGVEFDATAVPGTLRVVNA